MAFIQLVTEMNVAGQRLMKLKVWGLEITLSTTLSYQDLVLFLNGEAISIKDFDTEDELLNESINKIYKID